MNNIRIKSKIQVFLEGSLILSFFLVLALFSDSAFAGTGGSELNTIYNKIDGIIKGTGGKLLALSMFAGGTIHAISTHSVKIFVPAFLGSVAMGVGPGIVTSGFTALIP